MKETLPLLPDMDSNTSWVGETSNRAELLNKRFLLIFVWSLSCDHCKQVASELIGFLRDYADQLNLLQLHVPLDDQDLEFDRVLQQAENFGMNSPILMDNEHSFLSALGSKFLPALYLYDHTGRLCGKKIGFEEAGQWLLEQRRYLAMT